jgi:glycosyltransferase involved in cell wall biosynthesis
VSSPAVSVVLPVRDAAPTLGEALDSLARQSLCDLQVVAVDDGSVDGSGDILDRRAAAEPWLEVVHTPPRGLVAALNSGLSLCGARYVARMDADDISHPRRLELQARELDRRPGIGVVSCLVRHFPAPAVARGARLYEGWLNSLVTPEAIRRERFVESPVAHPSVMVRAEVLERVGGWRDAGWAEDYDLWLRLLEQGVRFSKVQRCLLLWREHGDRLTRTDPRYGRTAFMDCRAHYLLRGPLADRPPVVVWGAGPTGRRLARRLMDGGANLVAFVDIDPDKIGRRRHGVPVVGPEDLAGLLGPASVVLAAVASRGARDLIRPRLVALGLEEGVSFWCVA